MKKYLLFGYNNYYPSGGMDDYIGNFDSIEECNEKIKTIEFGGCDVYELVDYKTMECIDLEWTSHELKEIKIAKKDNQ